MIRNTPPEGRTHETTVVHGGSHSVNFSKVTYNEDGSQFKDPINLWFWGGEGSGWDVEYDMRNWTRNDSNHRWEDAAGQGCSTSHQWAWLSNEDGNEWWVRAPTASPDLEGRYRNIQVVADTCSYDSRYHARIFGSGAPDDGYLEWSIAAAHFEDWNWPCCGHDVQSWEDGKNRAQQSFRQWDWGTLLWFVGSMTWVDLGNSGTYQGVSKLARSQ